MSVKRGNTTTSWTKLRLLVWERDGAVCQVCGDAIEWKHYECGHIIDRVANGPDELENLVVMCVLCNRFKPIHATVAEYRAWIESGYWLADIKAKLGDAITSQTAREARISL